MKTSLFILCMTLTLAVSASSMATETQPAPHKTVLKKTNHTAACSTPQGKLSKECLHR